MSSQPHFFSPTPIWPRVVRFFYSLLFLGVCLGGAYYIIIYAPSVRESGALAPQGQQVVPLRDAGQTVYITARQQVLLNVYGAAFAMSLLVWLMLGLLLEMKLKIHLFRPFPVRAPRKIEHGPPTWYSPN